MRHQQAYDKGYSDGEYSIYSTMVDNIEEARENGESDTLIIQSILDFCCDMMEELEEDSDE